MSSDAERAPVRQAKIPTTARMGTFYDVGKPMFGELTLHPEAGFGICDPPEWDERLGALLREGRKRRVK
jgi:hypothetical protein